MIAEKNKYDTLMDRLVQDMTASITEVFDERLEDSPSPEILSESLDNDVRYNMFRKLFDHNGYRSFMDMTMARAFSTKDNKDTRIPLEDLLTSEHFNMYFPKVVTSMVMEAAEPEYNLTKLLEVVPFQGIVYRGPMFASMGGDFDMAEGDEPRQLELTGGKMQDVSIGKAGLYVSVTEEAMRYNEYNVLNMYIRAAGRALARFKEKKIADMLIGNAIKILDNDDSLPTAGTGIDGVANKTLSYLDIITACVNLYNKGYDADTLIMHPLAYPIMMLNGTLRSLFWASGGAKGSLTTWPKVNSWMPGLNASSSKPAPSGRNIASIPFDFGPLGKTLNIVLSPYMPFTAGTPAKTDILIGDSSALGMLILDQLPTTTSFDDPMRDIRKFKIIERYAIAPHYSGQGTVTIKNVNVDKSYDVEPFMQVSST